ncbi:hypothetical protein FOVG_14864 [Fusarium oxysporum f. sp. pisi HDV247]|uniref:Uncharacterized protein n=1 Tax=Fusarium oxysporum f. sp. pisi HDV247 TaxID=1080344 RepID=W9NTG6_FUSOX|nr:hypothetical protein FOVG_14864 [Fusarium oxysporum f. sp. pisi HDV247]
MKPTNAILSVLASQATAQLIDIQIGDTARLDIMRQAAEAQVNGNTAKAHELMDQIRIADAAHEKSLWKTDCRVSSQFEAEIYTVQDPSRAPKEIAWAMNFLDNHWKTDDGRDLPYPGDFDRFMHPDGFRVMRTDYKNLPWAVRKYHEELVKEGKQMERKFIAEIDGSAFFAPGVVTWLAPLFAGSKVEPGKDACEDDLVDFSNWDKKKQAGDGVRYTFGYGGKVQIGNHITVELHAQRSSKEGAKKEAEETRGDEETEGTEEL